MANLARGVFLVCFLLVFCPGNASAVMDTVSGIASSAGGFVKGLGRKAGVGMTTETIDRDARVALNKLLKASPAAAKFAEKARAILVFPQILKAGLAIGGHYGEGALLKNGKTIGYFNTAAGSYGLQIGAQAFGYVMFFMDKKGLDYLLSNNTGWEVGVGPSVVFWDQGMAKTMNNTTLLESVYVFTFSQKGLMAGTGLQGSKITRMNP